MRNLTFTFFLICQFAFNVNSQQIFQSRGVPASPDYFNYTQPDGNILTMRLYGDGILHWGETIDGYTVITNANGFYEFATLNGKDELIGSGVVAYNQDERKTEDLLYLQNINQGLRYSENQIDEKVNNHEFFKDKSPKMGGFPTIGDGNLVMLLVNYSDTGTTFGQTNFDQYMNAPGYDVYGSFKDFYLDASYGLLNVTTTVSEWITVSNTHDYYASKSRQLIYEALLQADANIDFSDFDNDGDGYVDGLAVIHQGQGQEASGDETDIWSHSWNLSGMYSTEQLTFDGVIVDAFTIQPELYGGGISTIGVMCHEFGHNLGAPDFYDTDYETCGQYDGTGDWDLMAGGSWNMSGKCPANHNAWTKIYFEWLMPVYINVPMEVTIDTSYIYPEAYICNTSTPNEYFLLENRQQIGFDQALPGHGLIIWHVDQNYIDIHAWNNDINACAHQGLYPKSPNGIINSSNTALPGNLNITDFNDFSNPNSNGWDGENTNRPFSGIKEIDGIISFDFMGGTENPDNFIATNSLEGFDINLSWTLNQNSDPVLLIYAQNYNQLGLPENGTTYSEGEILPSGGEVLYYGSDIQSFIHQNLSQSSTYYYRIFSNIGVEYSSGIYASCKTNCGIQNVIPFTEEFESFESLLECWNQTNIQGTKVWGSSYTSPLPFSGDYYVKITGGYNDETINKLETQVIQLQDNVDYVLKFAHHQPKTFSINNHLKIYYKNSIDGEWTLLAEYTESTTQWIEREIILQNPTEHYVIAFEGITYGIASLCIDKFSIDINNSIPENINNLNIYPNPTTGIVNISGQDILNISIFDLSGKKIYENILGADIKSIDLSDFQKGIYIIRVEQQNSVNFNKIIIE